VELRLVPRTLTALLHGSRLKCNVVLVVVLPFCGVDAKTPKE